jgi:RNA polymerase sigma-B factor
VGAHALADPSADGLIAGYQYLCRRGAKKFLRSGLERPDLEQVAAIGLIKASRSFRTSSGTPFEAYAWVMIVGELMHYVRDHERAIRVPRSLRALEPSLQRAHDACLSRLGREPSDAELAHEMGVLERTVADVRRARDCALPANIAEAFRLPAMSRSALELEDRFLVVDAFARLNRLERRLLVGVYVLGFSRLQLARRLGLPPRRVSRILREALDHMRRSWASGH